MFSPQGLLLFPEKPKGSSSVDAQGSSNVNAGNMNIVPRQENLAMVEVAQNGVVRESHRRRRIRLSPDFNINLPEDVIENILSFSPIKEAIRLSLLAHRYKRVGCFSRKIHFGPDMCFREDFVELVEGVFNRHEGPDIQSLRIHFCPRGFEEYAAKWIETAVEKGVEELELKFIITYQPFNLPPELLNTPTLRILKLDYCEVTHPPQLTGMRFLKVLVFRKVGNATADLIEAIVERCMLLECLDITECCQISQLRIFALNHKNFKVLRIGYCPSLVLLDVHASRLCSLHYYGLILEFRLFLTQFSDLKDVRFHLSCSRTFIPYFLVERLLHHFVHATRFTTSGAYLECFCATTIKEGTTSTQRVCLGQLKELQVLMRGATFINTYDIACFIRNCPKLKKLFLDLDDFVFETGTYYELHHKELVQRDNQPFTSLKTVKIEAFKFQDQDLELVKFILRTAPKLENLVLVIAKNDYRIRYCVRDHVYYRNFIYGYWRASPNVQIKIYEYDDDRSDIHPRQAKYWF